MIFIVLHHEIFANPTRMDEMVFHIASSLENAIKYIRSRHVNLYSWWEVQQTPLDDGEWPEHVGYYGLRGGKLKKPPYEKALAAYKKVHGQI